MHATLTNYRQSPRKVRLIADLIKGKTVERAYLLLDHTSKRATAHIRKLIVSAVANAKQKSGGSEKDFIIRDIRVDEGATLKRYRPVSRGRAHPIRKRTSTIVVELARKQNT